MGEVTGSYSFMWVINKLEHTYIKCCYLGGNEGFSWGKISGRIWET